MINDEPQFIVRLVVNGEDLLRIPKN